MAIWAIVPVKPFRRGKSRLSSVLNEDERFSLSEKLLKNTLLAISQVPEIEKTLVVTNDPFVIGIARDLKMDICVEEYESGMNQALAKGLDILKKNLVTGAIILPSDLPFICPREIQYFIKLGKEKSTMVIAPDRRKDGTNAIFFPDLASVDFEFGPMSYKKHVQHAIEKGLQVKVFESDSFGLDIDLPEDLSLYNNRLISKAAII
jgi:2-phospho-L-lactate guanylyltransferase